MLVSHTGISVHGEAGRLREGPLALFNSESERWGIKHQQGTVSQAAGGLRITLHFEMGVAM